MDKPLLVVNFKTYESASGQSAEVLAASMENQSVNGHLLSVRTVPSGIKEL